MKRRRRFPWGSVPTLALAATVWASEPVQNWAGGFGVAYGAVLLLLGLFFGIVGTRLVGKPMLAMFVGSLAHGTILIVGSLTVGAGWAAALSLLLAPVRIPIAEDDQRLTPHAVLNAAAALPVFASLWVPGAWILFGPLAAAALYTQWNGRTNPLLVLRIFPSRNDYLAALPDRCAPSG